MTKRPGEAINLDDARFNKSSPVHSFPASASIPNDPAGEEAYLLAFHAAAKMKPPRIPNPLAYPNSPTAQAHIKSRTSRFSQPTNTRVPNSTYVPPPPDVHSKRRAPRRRQLELEDGDFDSASPTHSSSASPSLRHEHHFTGGESSHSQSQIRVPPQHQYQHHHPAVPPLPHPLTGQSYGQQQSYGASQRQDYAYTHAPPQDGRYEGAGLNTLEPQMQAPSGPRNPFR